MAVLVMVTFIALQTFLLTSTIHAKKPTFTCHAIITHWITDSVILMAMISVQTVFVMNTRFSTLMINSTFERISAFLVTVA